MTRRIAAGRPAAALAVLAAAAVAPAAAAQPSPETFWVRVDPEVVASAETVARARRAVTNLRGVRGLTVLDPTAVDPLTIEYVGRRGEEDRIVRALRAAGVSAAQARADEAGDFVTAAERAARDAEQEKARARIGFPGRRPDPAAADRRAEFIADRRAEFIAERGLPNPIRPGRPTEMLIDLSEPLGDRGDAAAATLAAVPGAAGASFAVPPAPDHRRLVVRAPYADGITNVLRDAPARADVPVSGFVTTRFPDEDGTDEPPPADPAGPGGTGGPQALTVTLPRPQSGGEFPDLTAEVEKILKGVGVPGLELLVADWPGRTLLLRHDGGGDLAHIEVTTALNDAAFAAVPASIAAATAGMRAAGRSGSFDIPPGVQDFGGAFATSKAIADPAAYEPPTRTARTAVLTLRTPVPGNHRANTAAARRAFQSAGVGRATLTEADWQAGRVVVKFIGYPWGGDRLAETLSALGATVLKQTTTETAAGQSP